MRPWQSNVLFIVGVGGAILLLVGPSFGLDIKDNPLAYTGVGAILTYVLSQKSDTNKKTKKDDSDAPTGE